MHTRTLVVVGATLLFGALAPHADAKTYPNPRVIVPESNDQGILRWNFLVRPKTVSYRSDDGSPLKTTISGVTWPGWGTSAGKPKATRIKDCRRSASGAFNKQCHTFRGARVGGTQGIRTFMCPLRDGDHIDAEQVPGSQVYNPDLPSAPLTQVSLYLGVSYRVAKRSDNSGLQTAEILDLGCKRP